MSDIEDSEENLYLQIKSDFVYFWCKEYGLPDIVGLYLDRKRIRNGEDILQLARKGVERKVLSSAEMNLLHGALQQYSSHQAVVDEIITEKAAERKEDMLKRARIAMKSGKSLEELEFARKIIVRISLQQEEKGELEMTPQGTPRVLPLLRKNKHEAKPESTGRSLADRIHRRREKLGLYSRSESAPVEELEQLHYRNKKSSLSSPSCLGSYAEVDESESRLLSDSRSQFTNQSPLPGIGTSSSSNPSELAYMENGGIEGQEENNNKKKKKRKHKKSKRKRADTESPKAVVTVECEIHDNNYRPRSASNPDRLKKPLAINKSSYNSQMDDQNDIDTIELAP